MRKFFAAALGSAVALVGFAGAANATATVDLIWQSTDSSRIGDTSLGQDVVLDSAEIVLNVILTAGPAGSAGAGVTVDYLAAVLANKLSVSLSSSQTSAALPLTFGSPIDSGSQVTNINASAIPGVFGTGLVNEGDSALIGTVTFHKAGNATGTFEIKVGAFVVGDDVLNLAGETITDTTIFNSAFLVNVPEPGALAMLAMGLGGMLLAGRGRRS